MLLIYPEWQGCHSTTVHEGALWLEKAFTNFKERVVVDSEIEAINEGYGKVRNIHSILQGIKKVNRLLLDKRPPKIFLIGGTCGTETAPIGYLNKKYEGKLGVVWFDAHGDLNLPTTSPSGYYHGMVLRTLLGGGPKEIIDEINLPLRPEQVVLAGLRELDSEEIDFIEQENIHSEEVIGKESGLAICELIRNRGLKNIYIHIDVDVLNPESYSDMLMPTLGGPTIIQLSNCIKELTNKFEIVGYSIVEYCGSSFLSRQQLVEFLMRCGLTI